MGTIGYYRAGGYTMGTVQYLWVLGYYGYCTVPMGTTVVLTGTTVLQYYGTTVRGYYGTIAYYGYYVVPENGYYTGTIEAEIKDNIV